MKADPKISKRACAEICRLWPSSAEAAREIGCNENTIYAWQQASCNNCAYSCVISLSDHNGCMGGRCTCCNDWCFNWIPENDVSKFLRENYHYNDHKYSMLSDLLGSDFLNECNDPQKTSLVMDALQIVAKFDGKMDGDGDG